jgi:hypothetical protein
MDARLNPHLERDQTQPETVPVHLIAWGLTDCHAETAVQSAQRGSFRAAWRFAQVERETTGACPIDVTDPKVIAADCGPGWAYAVYPAGTAS